MRRDDIENSYLASVLRNFENRRREVFCHFARGDSIDELTWGDLENSAQTVLKAYRATELPRGAVILIFLRHVPELYGCFVGAMLGGFVPSFMPCPSRKQDPDLYWKSHASLFARVMPGAVVADRATLEEMSSHGIDLTRTTAIALDDVAASPDSDRVAWTIPSSSEIALLQHSSGTTGLKKGVALSYAAIAGQVRAYQEALVLREDDLIASWLPLYHDMGLIACLIVPLSAGVPTIHIDPFEWTARPGILFERITQFHATLCWLPNFAFEHLATVARRDAMLYKLASVRAFVNCSEVCKPETFDRFVAAFSTSGVTHAAMQCCYAMAETVFAVTQTRLGQAPKRIWIDRVDLGSGQEVRFAAPGPGSKELVEVGSTIAGAVLRAHDGNGTPLPDGVVGELGVSADFLFKGYYQQPDLTNERLREGVYFTRDLGFTLDGSVFVLGRLDDVIIVNGRNLYAHEVESLIQGVPGIKRGRSVAVPWNDERNGTQALALIAERDGSLQRADSAIRSDVLSTVFSVTQVTARSVHLVPEGWLVKTTSGKISRDLNLKKLQKELANDMNKA